MVGEPKNKKGKIIRTTTAWKSCERVVVVVDVFFLSKSIQSGRTDGDRSNGDGIRISDVVFCSVSSKRINIKKEREKEGAAILMTSQRVAAVHSKSKDRCWWRVGWKRKKKKERQSRRRRVRSKKTKKKQSKFAADDDGIEGKQLAESRVLPFGIWCAQLILNESTLPSPSPPLPSSLPVLLMGSSRVGNFEGWRPFSLGPALPVNELTWLIHFDEWMPEVARFFIGRSPANSFPSVRLTFFYWIQSSLIGSYWIVAGIATRPTQVRLWPEVA